MLVLLGNLAACTPLRIRSDYDAGVDLSVCRTFGWMEKTTSTPAGAFDNPINDKRVRNAVSQRLAARGMQPVAEGAMPDCLVNQAIGLRNSVSGYGGSHVGAGWGWGWGPGPVGSLYWDNQSYVYREGRISVDLYKAAGNEPLWHAEAEVDVSELTGADAEKRIDTVVTAIFARYPGAD